MYLEYDVIATKTSGWSSPYNDIEIHIEWSCKFVQMIMYKCLVEMKVDWVQISTKHFKLLFLKAFLLRDQAQSLTSIFSSWHGN